MAGLRSQRGGMLGTSRLLAVGVFLVGVLLGASVCGAGNPLPDEQAAAARPGDPFDFQPQRIGR